MSEMVKYEIPSPQTDPPSRKAMIEMIVRVEASDLWEKIFKPKPPPSLASKRPRKLETPGNKEFAAAKALYEELNSLSDDELSQRHQRAVGNRNEKICEQREQEERTYIFNRPQAVPDFDHWARAPYWRVEELVALTLGREPQVVSAFTLGGLRNISPFAKEYMRRRDLIYRAVEANELGEKNIPTFGLAWLQRRGIEIDERLIEAIERLGLRIADWQSLYEELQAKLQRAEALIAEQAAQIEELNGAVSELARPDKIRASAETKRRNTLLKLVAGAAFDGYGWRPRVRGAVAKDLENATEKIGSRVGQDAIRDALNEASDFVVIDPEGQ